MKKPLTIIILSLMLNGNTFAEKFKLPDGTLVLEKSFVDKILDKFKSSKKTKKKKTFSLSCEGEILVKFYDNFNLHESKKEIYFEDFQVEVTTLKNKKEISVIEMTDSSHHYGRDNWYYTHDVYDHKANLSVTKDNMQLSLRSLNRNDGELKFNESPSRLSLKSGVYSGRVECKMGNWTTSSEWRSKCAGAAELARYLRSSKEKSYLDYWWAVILIIAITFFIFTQSGKRLKKIRRK